MNVNAKKYYEVWAYKNKDGVADYNYSENYLVTSDKELKSKEDFAKELQEKIEECDSSIINFIISWEELCYAEFMECISVVVRQAC